jgi:Protein of unknown function (DUF3300)
LFMPKEHTMTKSVISHARWIGNAVLSGLVAAGAIGAVHAISDSNAQTVAAPPPPAAPAAVSNAPRLSAQQLDSLTAPIALYPDALLAQVLMATTFPDDLVAAATWSKQNPKLTGDDAVRAVASKPWDPSVQSLVAFPQALATMAQKPDWVSDIGQAFLAQPNDVMDSVQRLRNAAYKAGNLSTTSQQKVVVQPASTTAASTIVIEPANPQVVYVPTYNPTVVYGAWPYPTYPPVYMPPPPGYVVGTALVSGLAFGAGIAITNSLWGGCDWGHNDVNVNVNRFNNINVNNRIDANRSTANWDRSTANINRNRNAANNNRLQSGVANRNAAGGLAAAAGGANANRNAFRGRDDAQRDQARSALSQRTGQNLNSPASDRVQNIRQGGNANGGLARNDRVGGQGSTQRDVGNRAQNMNRDNALRDAGNGSASRQNFERGQQSRNAAAGRSPQGAGLRGDGGGNVARPSGGGGLNRGGGGGGGHGGGGLGGGGHRGGGGLHR